MRVSVTLSCQATDQNYRSEQDATPLLDAVRSIGAAKSVHPFHIPGHKVGGRNASQVYLSGHVSVNMKLLKVKLAVQRGQGAPESIKDLIGLKALQHDLTELPGKGLQSND